MSKLKIAVVMSTYNGEKYIKSQLESILNQKFNHDKFELHIYIRDDGSSDSTLKIISEYESKYPLIIRQVDKRSCNLGVKSSFFRLIKLVKADYYFFSDQDDIWLPNKLNKFMIIFDSERSDLPIGIYSDLWIADKNGVSENKTMKKGTVAGKKHENYLPILLTRYLVTGASFAINNCTAISLDDIHDEDLDKVRMHDSFIALFVAMYGKLNYIDEPLINYRQHGNNVVGASFKSRANVFSKIIQIKKVKKDKKQQVVDFYLMSKLHSNQILEENKQLVTTITNYVSQRNPIARIKILFPIRRVLSAKNPILSLMFYAFIINFSQIEIKGLQNAE